MQRGCALAVLATVDVSLLSICAGGGHLKLRVSSGAKTREVDIEIDGTPTAEEALDAVATIMLYVASKLPTRAAKRSLLQSGRVTVEDV